MIRFCRPRQLREQGILGMNERNGRLIGGHNPRHLFPRVDDKLRTKQLAEQAGIAVPELLGVIRSQHDARHARTLLPELNEFVIKPAQGSGGKGILVIAGRQGAHFIKANGERISLDQLERHLSNIISGLYSLGGKPDVAMIEARIAFDPVFADYSYEGVPDIRVITFYGYPVMAMLRLATQASDGKANLHQGAVGVGIDLASGRGLTAVQYDEPITHHPDTGHDFSRLTIPHWQAIMTLSAQCYEVTELGYMGCDIVLDEHKGPQVLEMNARPGLAIQIANNAGLRPRLAAIEHKHQRQPDLTPEQRALWSAETFGQQAKHTSRPL